MCGIEFCGSFFKRISDFLCVADVEKSLIFFMKDSPKLKADKVLNVKSAPIYSIKSLLNVYTNHFPITLYLSVNYNIFNNYCGDLLVSIEAENR